MRCANWWRRRRGRWWCGSWGGFSGKVEGRRL